MATKTRIVTAVPLTADEAPLDPMTRELEATKAMKARAAKPAAKAAATKAAKKDDPRGTHKGAGFCRRVVNGKFHNASVPADKPNWTWCRACVTDHAAAKRAEAGKAPAKPRVAKTAAPKRPARNSGGQARPSKNPPARSMGSGAVARIPSAPEGFPPMVQLVAAEV